MLDRTEFTPLIPHAGGMCLLDSVLAWDATTIHAVSESHARVDNPLRGPEGLHAVHLAEYGAQAMAVHGALRDRAQGATAVKPGRLVSLRDVQLAVEHVDASGGRLDVHAECLFADDAGAQYAFRVEQGGRVLASGRAAVIHPREPSHD
ncbi:phosphotransferase [Dyella ginsengisoli]|uniref:Phosphotransferase n=1 Tax=Dyella ginsengisoli TaxID=363848 RepID=A0ABW8JS05_9GAMM